MDSPSVPDPEETRGPTSAPPPGSPVRGERERILAALIQVGAERGYEGITVDEVVRVAGVDTAEFERHFADKEACFLAAYGAMSDVMISHAAAAFAGTKGSPWADRVAAALRALVALLASEAELARMPMLEVTALGAEARVRYRVALDRFIPFLEQGREASEQGADLPAETARLAIGGASSLIVDEFRAGRGAELEAILPDLVFAVTMPYLGVEAARAEMRKVNI